MALRGTLTHRKTRRLAQLISREIPCALGVMEALWHVTATYAPTGAIGKLSNKDIAEEMFWTGDPDALISAFVEAGLLDEHPEHRLVVHDWHEHAPDAIHMSLARACSFFANGTAPRLSRLAGAERAKAEAFYAHGTAQKRTEAHDEQIRAHAVRTACAPPSHDPPMTLPRHNPPTGEDPPCIPPTGGAHTDPPPAGKGKKPKPEPLVSGLWEEFLAAYPRRNGDRGAAKGREAYTRFLSRGENPELIVAGALRYRAWSDATGKTGTEFVKQIPSWLNGRCWEETWDPPPLPVARGSPNGRETRAPPSPREQYEAWLSRQETDENHDADWITEGRSCENPVFDGRGSSEPEAGHGHAD